MNSKDYIASGILENYVLGLTSAEESREVEKLASQHAEIRAELDAIEKALNTFAEKHAVSPPAYLKAKVLSAVINPSKNLKVIEKFPMKEERKLSFTTLLAAASVLTGVIMAGLFFSQRSASEKQIGEANGQRDFYQKQYDSLVHVYDRSREQVAVLMDKESKMVCLMGVGKNTAALAHVYWNSGKDVFLEVNSLPLPADSMQYQLWALKDGKPISAGIITMSDSLTVEKMTRMPEAEAFAITLEKKGGSETPQGEMYVMGKVTPAP